MSEFTRRRRFYRIQIGRIICLLVTVGILCISQKGTAQAASLGTTGLESETEDSNILGNTLSSNLDNALDTVNNGTNFNVSIENGNGSINGALQILIVLTLIALAPTLLIMLTSFTRIIIVLHFTRAALSTQTSPPNQVLIGIALFLTMFVMSPTISTVYNEAIVPLEEGQISQQEAFDTAMVPIRNFMYTQTQSSDVRVFMEISQTEWDGTLEGIPLSVLIPSFIVGELRVAFQIGFLIYIPFIVIDMVVASTLMSMGMMMLPPTTISMPFKILLFILADGWNLIIGNLVKTFY